ncbi:hypothetical protein D3C80_1806590 [compost metagenome]
MPKVFLDRGHHGCMGRRQYRRLAERQFSGLQCRLLQQRCRTDAGIEQGVQQLGTEEAWAGRAKYLGVPDRLASAGG